MAFAARHRRGEVRGRGWAPGAAKRAERARGAIESVEMASVRPQNWVRKGPRRKIDGDSPPERGRTAKDASRRAFRARSPGRAAKRGKAGNIDDGPREACRGKNRRKTGQGGVQGISRLSLRAVHVGEQRDRSRDSVAKAEVARRRHRVDRFRDGSGRLLRGFGGHCPGWADSAGSAEA